MCWDLVEEAVEAHGAVPLLAAHHVVLDVHYTGATGHHGDHVVALASQVVTGHERGLLALSEGRDVACQGGREKQEEEQDTVPGTGVVHLRTEGKEEKLSGNIILTAAWYSTPLRFRVWV